MLTPGTCQSLSVNLNRHGYSKFLGIFGAHGENVNKFVKALKLVLTGLTARVQVARPGRGARGLTVDDACAPLRPVADLAVYLLCTTWIPRSTDLSLRRCTSKTKGPA
eukprot:3148633-Rhodomonas_salina.1